MNNKTSKLDKTQQNALNLFSLGYNLFITGAGGRGKSFLINQMTKYYLKDSNNHKDSFVVTSTTGLSSLNIQGITLHSWAGINPQTDLEDIDQFIRNIRNNNRLANRWRFTKVLVIDEISMLTGSLLDFLDRVAKEIRCPNKPFGGLQLIITGDFLQLPPVENDKNLSDEKIDFAFKAQCFSEIIDYTITLKKCYRQNENTLIQFLDKIRVADIDTDVIDMLEKYSKNTDYNDCYTHLYPTKTGVESHNQRQLDKLPGDLEVYLAKLIAKKSANKDLYVFPRESPIMETLQLLPGAFVLINKNIDQEKGLVNGLQATYIKNINNTGLQIRTPDGTLHIIKRERWEFNNYYIEQYPLRLAWAITIHKSQGMGIEKLSVDIGNSVFSEHQAYVALSRATSGKSLHIKSYSANKIKVNKEVLDFYLNLKEKSKTWYLCQDSDSDKQYYQNSIGGQTRWKKPKGNVIIISKIQKDRENGYKNNQTQNSIDLSKNCGICNENRYEREYFEIFDEKICCNCISNDSDYRVLNRTDLNKEFKGIISQKCIKEVLDLNNLLYKSQSNKFGNRYGRSTKLYLLKQVRSEVRNYMMDKKQKSIDIKSSSVDTISELIKRELTESIGPSQDELLEKLKGLRSRIAQEKGLPPYCIFNNKTLDLLVNYKVNNLDELKMIKGFGPSRINNYGNMILEIVKDN